MKSFRPTLPLDAFARYAIAALALLLTACVSAPPPAEPRSEPGLQRVVGVVNRVDPVNRAVEITVDRDSRIARGQRISLYYDDLTTVEFEGQAYRPEDLESGDRIVADVEGDAAFFEVQSILVTEDGSPDDDLIPATDDLHIAGTLRRIDTRGRTLTVDASGRGRETVVRFDTGTRVLYGDRNIAITELREFDELEIELVPGTREGLADTITVVDSRYPAEPRDDFATASGVVVFVDESRRELVVTTDDRFPSSLGRRDSFETPNSFDTGEAERATFLYDRNLVVEYQGEFYSPSNLERGDGVEIEYERIGDDLWAKRILVTYSARH